MPTSTNWTTAQQAPYVVWESVLLTQAALQCSPLATTDVIENSGSAEQLTQAVEAMHHRYTTLWI